MTPAERDDAIRQHIRGIEALLDARLGSDGVKPIGPPRSPADLDDMSLPEGGPIEGPDWTDIANAAHETGWSTAWIRKHRRKLGVRRAGQWFISRARLARFPKPKPAAIKFPSVSNRIKA
jgi:hypothetical protein